MARPGAIPPSSSLLLEKATPSQTSLATSNQEAQLALLRLIDSQIVERSAHPVALKSLETLSTILSNAVKAFEDGERSGQEEREKVRRLRLNNPAVKRNVVDVPGAVEYLLGCRFAHQVHLFEPYLAFPLSPSPSQLSSLRLGHSTLVSRLAKMKDNAVWEDSMKQREEAAEAQRKVKALSGIRDDRQTVERRVARERLARKKLDVAGSSPTASHQASVGPSDSPPSELEPDEGQPSSEAQEE